jgi:hypothetical protein
MSNLTCTPAAVGREALRVGPHHARPSRSKAPFVAPSATTALLDRRNSEIWVFPSMEIRALRAWSCCTLGMLPAIIPRINTLITSSASPDSPHSTTRWSGRYIVAYLLDRRGRNVCVCAALSLVIVSRIILSGQRCFHRYILNSTGSLDLQGTRCLRIRQSTLDKRNK